MRIVLVVLLCFPAGHSEIAPHYTNEWVVETQSGLDKLQIDAIARRHGFRNYGKIGNLDNVYRFVHNEDKLGRMDEELTNAMSSETQVTKVQQQIGKERVKKEYLVPYDKRWKKQWSLKNTGQTNGPTGLDLNVEKAWIQGVTGKGVLVGVVDDGLEWGHPDIKDNYDSSASHDFMYNDGDPTPDPSSGDEPNSHGTSCAGEIAMVNNSHCGIGVAYQCKVASLKFSVGSNTADSEEASALGYLSDRIMIYSNSWGPGDYGFFVDGPESLTKAVFSNGAHSGRGGKGSIYVWAAGNGGWYYDSCAADGYVNSIYTIAVGSADQNGEQAGYDESCTAKMAVTFSYNSDTFPTADNKWSAYNQITTLDLHGGCTDGFTGTSASTPLVSAVIALTLEANANLTWRDVQYLLVYTSDTTKLSGGDWKTNGAGLKVSSKFGFGAVDAEAMVTRARNWINVPQQLHSSLYSGITNTDGYSQKYRTFSANIQVSPTSTSIRSLEQIVLTLKLSLNLGFGDEKYSYQDFFSHYDIDRNVESFPDFEDIGDQKPHLSKRADDKYPWLTADHARRGDIMVELTSPHGTKSTLLPYRKFDYINTEGYDNWPFMSVHHWGENPVGSWTITVTYKNSHAEVIVKVHGFDIYGTSQEPEAVSRIPKTCDPACARGCAAAGPEYCDACKELRDYITLECISECGENFTEYNGYCGVILFTNSPQDKSIPAFVIPTVVVSSVFILLFIIVIIAVVCMAVRYHRRSTSASYHLVAVEDFDE